MVFSRFSPAPAVTKKESFYICIAVGHYPHCWKRPNRENHFVLCALHGKVNVYETLIGFL